jgi:tRNA A37 threonylcarbamoyladenosine dehydratase
MAIPWFSVLQAVPWGQVIDNAPKVVDGARRFWNAVAKRQAPEEAEVVDVPATNEAAVLSMLRQRLRALESANAELQRQMLESSELIKNLADQNAQLIRRIEANRKHMVRLTWLAVFSAVVMFGIVAFAVRQHAG